MLGKLWLKDYLGQGADAVTSSIKKEEKQQIKARALDAGVVEPAPVLALQNSLMVAKIMRYEFPHDWYDIWCWFRESH